MAKRDDAKWISERAKVISTRGLTELNRSLEFQGLFEDKGFPDSTIGHRIRWGIGGRVPLWSIHRVDHGHRMKIGRTDPKDKEAVVKVYGKCREFWTQFEKEFGTNVCYNITGFHLDNEEERQKWLASGGMESVRSSLRKPQGCSVISSMKSGEDIDASAAAAILERGESAAQYQP